MQTSSARASRRNISATSAGGIRTGNRHIEAAPVTIVYGAGSTLPAPEPTSESRNRTSTRTSIDSPYQRTAAPAPIAPAPVAPAAPAPAAPITASVTSAAASPRKPRSAAAKARDAAYQRNKRAARKLAAQL